MNQPTPNPQERAALPTARIVVTSTIYHQIHNDQPTATVQSFVRWLMSNEAIYSPNRQIKIGQEWQTITYGWIEKPSLVIIQNNYSKPSMRKEGLDSKMGTLEVAFGKAEPIETGVGMWATIDTPTLTPCGLVLPGEFLQVTPLQTLSIRCREGEGVYSVIAVEE